MLKEELQALDLSAEERRKLLRDECCQLVLATLAEQTPPVDCRELAELIASREPGVDETDEEALARVAVSLRYTHLPTLADWGLIEYDPEINTIEPRDGESADWRCEKWQY